MTAKSYLNKIVDTLKSAGDPDKAIPMKAYMKHQFDFLGIKSPERRELSKPLLRKNSLPATDQIWPVIRELWILPQREFQYFAMELIEKYNENMNKRWIDHYEYLIVHKSWWDTVDFVAINLVGQYFIRFPEMIPEKTGKWMKSGDIWLQRSCLLFQLKYKKNTDTDLLVSFILPLSVSSEFFIKKAIGWSLREYSKTDPDWVQSFILNHELPALSKKEGLKRIS
jgi:3-methyladenine DNA glycosylase AlkD